MKKIALEYWLKTYRELQSICGKCKTLGELLDNEDAELVEPIDDGIEMATITYKGGEFDVYLSGGIELEDEFRISDEYGSTLKSVSFHYLKLEHEEFE